MAQESGRINKSDWEEVTNGKDYFEKSGENEPEQETTNSKQSRSPKKESNRGYDSEERPRSQKRSSGSLKIPSSISYILIGLILLALVIAIAYSAGNVKIDSKIDSSELDEQKLKEIEENPFENDLERMIHEALQSRNFKLAIRLQFIYIVRLLSEKNLITWKKHKTNSAYSRELKKHAFSNKYNHLNLLFEHVWYGNMDFSETDLSEINSSFNDSVTHLKNLKQ